MSWENISGTRSLERKDLKTSKIAIEFVAEQEYERILGNIKRVTRIKYNRTAPGCVFRIFLILFTTLWYDILVVVIYHYIIVKN